jgi:mannose-6-phosphate isomerase-like protein (cupin superfamily)
MTSTVNFTQPELAENIEMKGLRMSLILSTECSGGKLTIIEQEVGIGTGSPTCICSHEDKVILVTNGRFMLFAGNQKYEAEAGASIFIPRGTLHSFTNQGTQTGKLLITLTPNKHETSLKNPTRLVKMLGKDPAYMQNVARKYNVVMM